MLTSALVLGLLGSLHCLGMCGPIAFMLPLDQNNGVKRLHNYPSTTLGDYWHTE